MTVSTSEALYGALRTAGVPIVGVSVGADDDRTTWRVDFAPEATDADKATAAALVASFDPTSQAVQDAASDTEARETAQSRAIRAMWLWFFRKLNRRDPTEQERATDLAALAQAFKDTAE